MRTAMMALGMVLLTACTSGNTAGTASGSGASPHDGGASSEPTGSIDMNLVGQWYAGRGGTTVSYDTTTGTFGPGSGSGLLFVFDEDGTYVKASQTIEDGPCVLGQVSTESGTVTMTESELLLHPTHGTLRELNCGATSEKPLAVVDDSLAWSLAPSSVDPSIPALTLTNTTGASSEFRKTK